MGSYVISYELLEKAESALKDLLVTTMPLITIGPKDNQALIADALADTQSAIRSLLMLDGNEKEIFKIRD